jgi:hypothetical protein
LALTDKPAIAMTRPWLVESRWVLSSFRADSRQASFRAIGFGPGEMTFRVPDTAAGERWEARLLDKTYVSGAAGKDGIVRFRLPAGAENGVDIVIRKSELRPALL